VRSKAPLGYYALLVIVKEHNYNYGATQLLEGKGKSLAGFFHERSVTSNSRGKKRNEPTTIGKNKEKKIRQTNHYKRKKRKEKASHSPVKVQD